MRIATVWRGFPTKFGLAPGVLTGPKLSCDCSVTTIHPARCRMHTTPNLAYCPKYSSSLPVYHRGG